MFQFIKTGNIDLLITWLVFHYVFSVVMRVLFVTSSLALSRTTVLCNQVAAKPIMGQYQPVPNSITKRDFSSLLSPAAKSIVPLTVCNPVNANQFRTFIKYSRWDGKRQPMKDVPLRFFRLRWGGWIRTKCAAHNRGPSKAGKNNKHRSRQHVMLNAHQSFQMDKMVTAFWRRPKHYINDPYEPYHTRTFHDARVKPRPYPEHPQSKPLMYPASAKIIE